MVQVQTTDINGKATFANLPYGTYVVSETAPLGYRPIEDFEVTISEEGQRLNYIIENQVIEAKVKIVKKDSETGDVIPVAGATFKIKDSEGNYIKQHINYPVEKEIEEFVTASDGTLVLPEMLTYGSYFLEEVKGPNGYLVSEVLVPFTIDENSDGQMVTVEFLDIPAKGKVKGQKLKEVIDLENSSTEDVVYKFVPAEGIEFDIVATKDIVTADGTVRATAGEVVDTVITDSEGYFESTKELYISDGNEYQLVEKNIPEEYRELAPVTFSIRYQNDITPIVYETVDVKNYLKKGTAEISKQEIGGSSELSGATLHIEGENVDLTWVSGEKPKTFELPDGSYTLTELLPNDGYQLNVGCNNLSTTNSHSAKAKQPEVEVSKTEKSVEKLSATTHFQKVGDEQVGYVNVPSDWKNFKDYDGNSSFQVSNPEKTQIISLNTIDVPEDTPLEDSAAIVYQNMTNNGGQNIQGSKLKLKDYDAIQVYATYDDGNYFVIAWIFKAEDGKVHYVAAEGIGENINEVVGFVENGGWSLE